jgi:endonuclease III
MSKQDILNGLDDSERRQQKIAPTLKILRDIYGDLHWTPGQDGVSELVSCILSQNTNDTNRDRGFTALMNAYPNWQAIVEAPEQDIIDVIRPAGLANQKGPRIQRALRKIYDERGEYSLDFLTDMPLEAAKNWLTSIKGIGPKTAAIVLCFGYNLPAFPVDTHVNRVSKRIGFVPEKMSVDKVHDVMEAMVPDEAHYAFHIYLIRHGRDTCTARTAHCERCPLTIHCDYYTRTQADD